MALIPEMPKNLKILEDEPKDLVKQEDPWLVIVESMHTRGFGNLFCKHQTGVVFNDKKKIQYLRAYATSGRKGFSAQAIGLSNAVVSKHAKEDPVFAAAMAEAEMYFQDLLLGEMYRRGVTGFKKQVLGGRGKDQIFEIVEYSDKALDMIARVHIPAMQRKQVEIKSETKSESTVTVVAQQQMDVANMHPDDLTLFKQLMVNQSARLAEKEAENAAIEGELSK